MVEHQFAHAEDRDPPGPGVVVDELRHLAAVLAKTDWDDVAGPVTESLVGELGPVRNMLDAVEAGALAS